MKPKLFKTKIAKDSRGSLSFMNELNLLKVKRFYIVQNNKNKFIRAWHGHMEEEKFMICIKGKALIKAVRISNTKRPSKKSKIFTFKLDALSSNFVHIPAGYANGTQSLSKNMKLLVLSTSSLKESIKDDFRYPENYWKF